MPGSAVSHETSPITVANLQLDIANARLGDEQQTQQQVYLKLAEQQGKRLISLAKDIVEHGLDPSTLPIVVPTDDRRRRYVVIEGNRRVLALKALETPAILSGALGTSEQKALASLSNTYHENPLEEINCVIFDTEEDARHWILVRHTGNNDGAGLVEWDSNELDRWRARHGDGAKSRRPGGQALDFIERITNAKVAGKLVTNLDRLVKSRGCRASLGLDLIDGELVALYPAEEVRKGLEKIIGDLTSKQIKVKDIYDNDDRLNYLGKFTADELPNPQKRLKVPVPLSELQLGRQKAKAVPPPKQKARSRPKPTQRTTVIPSNCNLNPKLPRLNTIYNELLTLDVATYPNAAAVLLRVFLELSVDHYLNQTPSLKPAGRQPTLADKLKLVATHLEQQKQIPTALKNVIFRIAGAGGSVLSASTNTFNQYVHNTHAFAKPQEIYTSWDELQPFMEKL